MQQNSECCEPQRYNKTQKFNKNTIFLLFSFSYTQTYKCQMKKTQSFSLISSQSTNTDFSVHNDQSFISVESCLEPDLNFIAPNIKNCYNLLRGGPFLCQAAKEEKGLHLIK